MLAIPVGRPAGTETTALGAAMLASVGVGINGSFEDARCMGSPRKTVCSATDAGRRDVRIALWHEGLRKHAG